MLLTKPQFREIYVTSPSVTVSEIQIEESLAEAEDEILQIIGSDALTDAKKDTPSNPLRASRVRRAHGKLAYRALLLIRAARFRDGGIVQSETDKNDGSVTNSYVKQSEIESQRKTLLEEAMNDLKLYVLPGETVEQNDGIMLFGSGSVKTNVGW